ncbi:MAG: DUF2271 domain-containing protein [Variovorax sp.]|nr:MAG: DUF2271 domain-containing protein [Variovorax sp.]
MKVSYALPSLALGALFSAPALAAGLGVSIEIPRLNVSEYHRPYVAAWIERADNTLATTLSVWYDVRTKTNNPEGEGTKWLKDMRQWWRRGGRELAVPVDGVTGATKPAGTHQLNFTEGSAALPKLAPGSYKLVVEAAREVGGREVVSIPFQWPPTAAAQPVASGKEELGAIKLELKP